MTTNKIDSQESKEIALELKKFCEENNLTQIPLRSKAEGLMFLSSKFMQVDIDSSFEAEYTFLKDFWAKNASNSYKTTMNDYQTNFLLQTKKAIIDEHKDFIMFKDESKTLEEKIMSLELLAFIKVEETKQNRDLAILLYYYYLAKYVDFLPQEKKASKLMFNGVYDSSTAIVKINALYENKSFDSFSDKLNDEKIKGLIDFLQSKISDINSNFKSADDIDKIIDEVYEFVRTIHVDAIQKKNALLIFSIFVAKYLNFLAVAMPDHALLMCQKVVEKIDFNMLKGSLDMMMDRFIQFMSESSEKIKNSLVKLETSSEGESIFKLDENLFQLKVQESIGVINTFKNNSPYSSSTPKEGCYIATMTYGDYNSPQVIILRKFRDNYLKKYFLGKVFISLYYLLSPKMVSMSKNNKYFIKLSRNSLDFFINKFLSK